MKSATKASLGGKKTLKAKIFRFLFSSKKGEVRSKKCRDYNKFGMSTSRLETYFPKVSERFSWKVATKASFAGKKSLKIWTFRLFF